MGVAVSKILRDFYICILGLRSVQLKAPLPTGKEAIALLYHFDYAPLRAYISLSPINR